VISEVELYRINIARKRAGLPLLSMAQARRAIEAHADVHGKFEITPFLVGYVIGTPFEQHDAVVATPSTDFSPSSSDTTANGGDGW
jgi:hypothetical protein